MSDHETTPEPDVPAEPVAPAQPTLEEQLSPESAKPTTLNKNGKPRKTLTAEANAIRQASCAKKYDDRTAVITDVIDKFEKAKIDAENLPKKSRKKKTKIIVEQSSDDSDEFEQNDNIVFVKRVSRKKKEPVNVPVKEPEYTPPAAREMEPEKVPMLTAQEIALKNQYNAMFSGGFLNKRSFY